MAFEKWEDLAAAFGKLNLEGAPKSGGVGEFEGIEELANWWLDQTRDELDAVIPKALEYGSADLKIVGFALSQMVGEPKDVTHDELGIAFYVLGKVARLIGGYTDGRKPSDDTWHDIAIYTKMAQFARYKGEWGGFAK